MASPSLWVLGALLSPVDPFRTVWSEAQATLPASFPLPPRAPETCEDAKEPGGIAVLLAETVSPPPLPPAHKVLSFVETKSVEEAKGRPR